jgi:sterol desaturase/sphingolipid hydroxylase (fatty acid hydroxylase superfamily)
LRAPVTPPYHALVEPLTEEEPAREAFRRALVARIPAWYRPWLHLAFPSLVGLAIVTGALAGLRDLRAWQLVMAPAAWVLLNAGEWRVHRDLLHKRTWPLYVLYDRHTPEHHRVFVTDDMAIRSVREFRLVLIPFYGILAAALAALPIPIAFAAAGQRNLGLIFLAVAMLYTVSYEWLHLAYHLPSTSRIGRSALIGRLRRHHAVHHAPALMQRWNFNVTVPLWDLVRGTIYRGEV